MSALMKRDVLRVSLRWHAMKVWGLSYGEADKRALSLLGPGGPLAEYLDPEDNLDETEHAATADAAPSADDQAESGGTKKPAAAVSRAG